MDTSDLVALDPQAAEPLQAEIELLRARAVRYARQEHTVDRNSPDAVVFERGGSQYGILVTDLREIRPLRRLCRIPGASRVVPGVFYYRGEILSAHDLGNLLLDRELSGAPPWVLVLEHHGERIGLLADSIIDIVSVPSARLRPPPMTFGEMADGFLGIIDGGALLVNPARLLASTRFANAF
jgi:chemotaxis signal transduction protein